MSYDTFIAILAPIVVQVRLEGSPLFPSVRLAQNILETGGVIPPTNNLGGYKVGTGKPNGYWKGEVAFKGTWEVYDGLRVEEQAAFRVYETIYDFYKDQDLLFMRERYARVRQAATPDEQADMLYASGYATDPQYAAKLKSLIARYQLQEFDLEALEEERAMQELFASVQRLQEQVQQLQEQNTGLQARVNKLESLRSMDAPAWAQDAQAAFAPYMDTPAGSYDLWRILTILYRQNRAKQ